MTHKRRNADGVAMWKARSGWVSHHNNQMYGSCIERGEVLLVNVEQAIANAGLDTI